MITLTQRVTQPATDAEHVRVLLTAEERTRSRHRFIAEDGTPLQLALPRGTVLRDGDLLSDAAVSRTVQVRAKSEPVMIARTADRHVLMRAAYHLGNRHVPLEVRADSLRLSPDPVLQELLERLGLTVTTEHAPFQPEAGAYGGHVHADAHVPFRPHP